MIKIRSLGIGFVVASLCGVLAGCAVDGTDETAEEALAGEEDLADEGALDQERLIKEGGFVREAFEDGTELLNGEEVTPGETRREIPTFWASCRIPKFVASDSQAYLSANSAGCRRRNGTYSGYVSWSGTCYSDIANCNGVLRCTSRC